MKRTYLTIIFIAISLHLLTAQNQYSTTDFLRTASSHYEVMHQQETVDFYKNQPHELPFLDEFEIRTESDEMDFGRQEYLTRFRFNAKKARNQQQNLHQKNTVVEEARSSILFQDVLEEHYELLLDYWAVEQKIALKQEQQLICTDQLKISQKLLQLTTDIDLGRLIEIEGTLHQLELDLLELSEKKTQIGAIFQHHFNTDTEVVIDTTGFISLSKIKLIIADMTPDSLQHPDLFYRAARLDASIANMEMERIEDRKIIDFVQLKYSGRNQLNFGEELSIGLGFQIPLKKSNQLKVNELMLDNLVDEHRLDGTRNNLSLQFKAAFNRLRSLYQQYDLVKKQREDSQANFTLNHPQNVAPFTLLQAKKSMLRLQQSLRSIEIDIRKEYLAILTLSGRLSAPPLQNYFMEDLNEF